MGKECALVIDDLVKGELWNGTDKKMFGGWQGQRKGSLENG